MYQGAHTYGNLSRLLQMGSPPCRHKIFRSTHTGLRHNESARQDIHKICLGTCEKTQRL